MGKPRVAVVGCGVWGRAFACAIADACVPVFWDRELTQAQAAAAATADGDVAAAEFQPTFEPTLAAAVAGVDAIILAVSSSAFAPVLENIARFNTGKTAAPLVWLTKGFDAETQLPLCFVARDILGADANFAALSGPSFAAEVEKKLPTALSLAANRPADFAIWQQLLFRQHLRIYRQDDIVGLCVGGAVKNIIAIAAGICDGMALGANARAALITRGLAEIGKITAALGGSADSVNDLSGIGDLILTCCSDLSRNRRLGLALAEQPRSTVTAQRLQQLTPHTCEGIAALAPVSACVRRHGLDTPIISTVAAVAGGQLTVADAILQLLQRQPPAA